MIKLTDTISITSDDLQYIVGMPVERRGKAGKAYIEMIKPTYHINLASALKSAIERAMREKVADGSITTLRDFITELRKLEEEFAKLIQPLETNIVREEEK